MFSRYTTVALMDSIWDLYKMRLCGTISLSKKKSRTVEDNPFHKVSNAALRRKTRGDYRRATRPFYSNPPCQACTDKQEKCKHRGPVKFVVQAISWKDKKEVGFLSNAHIHTKDEAATVKRWISKKRRRQNFQSHRVVIRYSARMGAIDRIDRAIRDWGISRRGVSFLQGREGGELPRTHCDPLFILPCRVAGTCV